MTKLWGPPTWIFIHSFLELMSDECYLIHKQTVINLLTSICSTLPCRDCTNHALAYMKKHPLHPNYYPTRKHLQYYFYKFHNAVNIRLGKPIFDDFNKYESARLTIVFREFQTKYRGSSTMDFTNNMARKNIINNIRTFINSNNNCFRWYY